MLLERLAEVPGVTVYGPSCSLKREQSPRFLWMAFMHMMLRKLLDSHLALQCALDIIVRCHCMIMCCKCNATARASFYLYNTPQEIEIFIEALYQVKKKFAI